MIAVKIRMERNGIASANVSKVKGDTRDEETTISRATQEQFVKSL